MKNFTRLFASYLMLTVFVFFNLSTSAFAVLVNGAPAVDLLGQTLYTTSSTGTAANKFAYVYNMSFDYNNHRLFVADVGNDRVLVFNLSPTNTFDGTARSADYVLGQFYTTSNTSFATNSMSFDTPEDLEYDNANDRLFVSDSRNHRVLVFNDVSPARFSSTGNGLDADAILGQPDNTTAVAGTTRAKLSLPKGLAYDSVNDRLFVAGSNNSRVMVYDVTTTVTGEDATAVIGQTSSTDGSGGIGQNRLSYLEGLDYDSVNERLFVADSNNDRVMIFGVSTSKLTGSETGINADIVLGQPDFNTAASGLSVKDFNYPVGVAYDASTGAERLFVVDPFNHRVLAFDAGTGTLSNYDEATHVLGQVDFDSGGMSVTQDHLRYPYGGEYDSYNDRMYVGDSGAVRVMVFDTDDTPPVPEFSTTMFFTVVFILGLAIVQKNGGLDALTGGKRA